MTFYDFADKHVYAALALAVLWQATVLLAAGMLGAAYRDRRL